MDVPFCGDGVADAGEGCDCGPTHRCLQVHSACAPPQGGYGGELGCTFRLYAYSDSGQGHRQGNTTTTSAGPGGGFGGGAGGGAGSGGSRVHLFRHKEDRRVKYLMRKFDQIVEEKYGRKRIVPN